MTKDLFEEVLSGKKNFDLGLANKEFMEGDILVLKEIDGNGKFTDRKVKKEITFVLKTKDLDFWDSSEIDKYGFAVVGLK